MFFYVLITMWMSLAFGRGDQIYGELCSIDEHCLGHLVCENGRCATPYPPSRKTCARIGFVYKDKKGNVVQSPWDLDRKKRDIQCPPFCGQQNSLIYGPICVLNERGCARSEECRVYGRCGFNGTECSPTPQGCLASHVCRDEGWCAYGKNYCQLSEEGCASSVQCKELGYCGLGEVLSSGNPLLGDERDRYDIRCVATPKGCAYSERCLQKGICRFEASKVTRCEGGSLQCFTSSMCVKGPPSPESYRNE